MAANEDEQQAQGLPLREPFIIGSKGSKGSKGFKSLTSVTLVC